MYRLKKKFKNEKGQGLVEYGLILALVSIVAILVLSMLGGSIKGQLEEITASMGGISEPGKGPGDSDGEIEVPGDSDGEIEVPGDSDGEIGDLIEKGYIPIATADELNNVRSATSETYGEGTKWKGTYEGGLDKQYIQVADIDLSEIENFEPIGTSNTVNSFTGIYDGGGYVISNLTINRGSNVGLFGRVEGATLKNIGLVNINVTGITYVGGLVGYQTSSSAVTNSYATGNVTGATGSVTGKHTGGLVGYQQDSSVTDSYATVSVTGAHNIGGLVGGQWWSSTVSNSYATGSVTGVNYVGGLVGEQRESSVSNSYATGNVTGTGTKNNPKSHTGGLVGHHYRTSTITNSYATGSVTGRNLTGGLVGYLDPNYPSTVTNSYYDTETTKRSDTGKGTGKTTEEMKNKDTYTNWDNAIWTIENNQYPTLR